MDEKLKKIILEVASICPLTFDGKDHPHCIFCWKSLDGFEGWRMHSKHDDDCTWVSCQKLRDKWTFEALSPSGKMVSSLFPETPFKETEDGFQMFDRPFHPDVIVVKLCKKRAVKHVGEYVFEWLEGEMEESNG